MTEGVNDAVGAADAGRTLQFALGSGTTVLVTGTA